MFFWGSLKQHVHAVDMAALRLTDGHFFCPDK